MEQKCVHKGCGKKFSDTHEDCIYHPGPPIFHEGQKGWKCCKPRVLTFDEFLNIPPCTTGKHSTVDDLPQPEPKPELKDEDVQPPKRLPTTTPPEPVTAGRQPQAASQSQPPAQLAPPESDSDEPDALILDDTTCKRRACGTSSSIVKSGNDSKCIYHPGQAVFHEGSKGWSCCKRRVLEFDEFMRIPGCKTRERHCFVGKKKSKRKENGAAGGEHEYEKLATVRNDFYQTGNTIHASLYLKKIDKEKSKVKFKKSGDAIELDLITQDEKQYNATVPLYGTIDPSKSSFNILGTKLDLTLAKTSSAGWPVLRADDRHTGEIIQTGSAGRA